MPIQPDDLLTTRPFANGDLARLIAWHTLGKPAFMAEQDNAPLAARTFIDKASNGGYEAVCLSGSQACRQQGLSFEGPLACIRRSFDGAASLVFVDPGFANNAHIKSMIEQKITPKGRARLKIA